MILYSKSHQKTGGKHFITRQNVNSTPKETTGSTQPGSLD